MIKNPGVKGVIFSATENMAIRQIGLCLKTLHHLKEQAKGVSYFYGYIEFFNDSIMYFRVANLPDTYCNMEFDFVAGKIPVGYKINGRLF